MRGENVCLDEEVDKEKVSGAGLLLGCFASSAIVDAIQGFCSLVDYRSVL